MAGNFGVYGRRPTWPPTPAGVTQWAVAATHSGVAIGIACSEGQIEPRKSPTSLSVNFDYALSAAAINSSVAPTARNHGVTLGGIADRVTAASELQKASLVMRAQSYRRRMFAEFERVKELLLP